MPQPSNRLDAGERVFFDTQLVAIDKRTYLQKYPEFKSRPTNAHPLFRGLIVAAIERQAATRLFEVKDA